MSENEEKIITHTLPGMMELLPSEQIEFDRMKGIIEETYRKYGFVPIDTPAIERAEVLDAKAGGETEKQIYKFNKGDTEMALRFDLTVPLARYVAEHENDLVFPFRRYHIGKSYRGESPQKGRFREFYQCDIDIIGREKLGLSNDAEIIAAINDVFTALNIGAHKVRVSNRKLLAGLAEASGISDKTAEVSRVIDRLEKTGEAKVKEDLVAVGLSDAAIGDVMRFASVKGSAGEVISSLRGLGIDNPLFEQGVSELESLANDLGAYGVPESNFAIDCSIVRGLDYYTGTVYETILTDHPEFGSVCGGGRYENLVSKFSNRAFPGVGVSIGLTRLFSQLLSAGIVKPGAASTAKVLVVPITENMRAVLELGAYLRSQGIAVQIYTEEAKMDKKMSYADKLSIPFAVIVGDDEINEGKYALKDLGTGEQKKLSKEEIVKKIG